MAIALDGSGGLFTILGLIGGILNAINAHRGTAIGGKVDGLADEYASDRARRDGLYAALASYRSSGGGYLATLQRLASDTLVAAVEADAPQPDRTARTAMIELIRQMRVAGESVSNAAVGLSFAATAGNTGAPVFVSSNKGATGYVQENTFPEALAITVAADAQTGGATQGRETLSLRGQVAATDVLGHDFPMGSGASVSLTLVDAAQDLAGGLANFLRNGDFEDWTGGAPSNWTIATGTPSGTVAQSAGTVFDGSSALSFVGDGSELTSLTQTLGVQAVAVRPLTQYSFNLWGKVSSAPAAGVLEVALVDGSGAILQDNNGADNKVATALTTLGTTFVPINGTFRTPRILPDSVKLRVRLSTALSAGTTLYLDRLAFSQMLQLYAQGPFVTGFSGITHPIAGDTWTGTVTNTAGSGQFQFLFSRLFDMRNNGLLLPSSGSPTIADALIA